MHGKNRHKKLIYYTILSLALVFVAPSGGKAPGTDIPSEENPFYGQTLNCVIDARQDIHSTVGLKAGLNYEILKRFAEQHGCPVTIGMARGGENYLDSLLTGSVDILVMETSDAPAYSAADTSAILRSRALDGGYAWYIKDGRGSDLKDLNLWIHSFAGTKDYKDLQKRFNTDYNPYRRVKYGVTSHRLSPYDDLIRKYAAKLGWDWRMLVAVVYNESKFTIDTKSRRGATGLMQIMPSTAAHYGVDDLIDPEQNIIAGTRFLAQIQAGFPLGEFSPEERINFTLAAYNAGTGRISDCRMFARSKGYDGTKWAEIVNVIPEMGEYTIQMPDSSITRSGRFKGTETVNYVNSVLDLYWLFCQICPER